MTQFKDNTFDDDMKQRIRMTLDANSKFQFIVQNQYLIVLDHDSFSISDLKEPCSCLGEPIKYSVKELFELLSDIKFADPEEDFSKE